MYYACLETISGKTDKEGRTGLIKVAFNTREEARQYISTKLNDDVYSKLWTE